MERRRTPASRSCDKLRRNTPGCSKQRTASLQLGLSSTLGPAQTVRRLEVKHRLLEVRRPSTALARSLPVRPVAEDVSVCASEAVIDDSLVIRHRP
jgi:hypothetical protein